MSFSLPTLQKRGLVEKIITTPATYQAIPIRDGVSLLLQRRKEEFEGLQKKTSALLEGLQETRPNESAPDDKTQFAILYDRALLIQKFQKGNTTSTKSIDCSGTWPGVKVLISMCNCRNDHLTKAMHRGVRIRLVTENRGDDTEVDGIIRGMIKNPLFGVRFIPKPMPVKIVLYDGKEVNTSISTANDTDVPSLWSNNPNFVRIMQNQFNEMWNRGTETL